MKKLLFVFIVLFLVGDITAQGLSARLDSLRTQIVYQTDIPTTGTDKITTAKLNAAINRAIYKTCDVYPAYPKLDTLYIKSSSVYGTLNTDFLKIRNCGIMSGDTLVIYLKPMNQDTMRYLYPDEKTNKQTSGQLFAPEHYATHGAWIFVHPRWLRADSVRLKIEYYAVDTTLEADSSQTSIDAEYLENVIYYACSIIEELRGNLVKSKYYLERFYEKF